MFRLKNRLRDVDEIEVPSFEMEGRDGLGRRPELGFGLASVYCSLSVSDYGFLKLPRTLEGLQIFSMEDSQEIATIGLCRYQKCSYPWQMRLNGYYVLIIFRSCIVHKKHHSTYKGLSVLIRVMSCFSCIFKGNTTSRQQIVQTDEDISSIENLKIYTYKELSKATEDFSAENKVVKEVLDLFTRGYLALEYAVRGQVTRKSDVYSFGVLLLEIISGWCNTKTRLPYEDQFLLERALEFLQVHNVNRSRREIKELIRQVEANCEFANSKRETVDLSPNDLAMESFLK